MRVSFQAIIKRIVDRAAELPAMVAMLLLCLGILLNKIVIRVNGGMPVAGITPGQAYGRWIVLTESTRLRVLADILPGHFSIGDILILGAATALAILFITSCRQAMILLKTAR